MNIFISHKHEDAETAILLKTKLEALGGGQVECFVSENISYGADWFENICTSLKDADALLLIFTSSDRSWDWCLYEVGLATNLSDLDDCRVITLYAPGGKPPDPIKHVQAVEASEQGIRELVISLFCTSDIFGGVSPVNPRLANDSDLLERFAKEVSERFQSVTPWEQCFTYFLWITATNTKLEREEVPRDAKIDPQSTALELFGLSRTPPGKEFWTWEGLLDAITRGDGESDLTWADELGERLYWASRGSTLRETRAALMAPKTGELYRPLLHRAKLRPDGSMQFELILVRHYELEDGQNVKDTKKASR